MKRLLVGFVFLAFAVGVALAGDREIPGPPGTAGGGATNLDELTDVTLTAPATGAVILKTSGVWVDGQLDLSLSAAVQGVLPEANIDALVSRDTEVPTGGDVSGTLAAGYQVDVVDLATANLEATGNSTGQVASTAFVQQEIVVSEAGLVTAVGDCSSGSCFTAIGNNGGTALFSDSAFIIHLDEDEATLPNTSTFQVRDGANAQVLALDENGNLLVQSIEDLDGPGTNWMITPAGDITATSYTGDGAGLTSLNATQLTTGTIPAARVGASHIDAVTEIAVAARTGTGPDIVTGAAGAVNECAKWDANGDLVTVGTICGGARTGPGSLVTGTAGSTGHCAEWDASGDLVTVGTICGGARTGVGSLVTGTAGALDECAKWDAVGNLITSGTGCGGSLVIIDLGDTGSHESSDLKEIATSGDTNSIFTVPSADKLLIDASQNWPASDLARNVDALGAAGITIGSIDVPNVTITTDGAGDGELALPLASVGVAEIVTAPALVGSAITALDASQLTTGTVPAGRVGASHVDAITEISAGLRSGIAGELLTGLAGPAEECAKWNANGDLVGDGDPCGNNLDAAQLLSGTVPPARVGTAHIDDMAELSAVVKSGSDPKLVTGTPGGTGICAEWDANGDLLGASSGQPCGAGGGGGAPLGAEYIVAALNVSLTAERVLSDGQGTDVVFVTNSAVVDFAYDKTLAGDEGMAAGECILSSESLGGGFLCEGNLSNANEELHAFASKDVEATDYIVTTADTGGLVDNFGNATALDAAGQINDFNAAVALNTGGNIINFSNATDLQGAGNLDTDVVQPVNLDDNANDPALSDFVLIDAADLAAFQYRSASEVQGDLDIAFTNAGDPIVPINRFKNFEIGPQSGIGFGKMEVVGADPAEITLLVEAELAQTADVLVVQDSAGVDLVQVLAAGDVKIAQALDVEGLARIGDITIEDASPRMTFDDTSFAGVEEGWIEIASTDTDDSTMTFNLQKAAEVPVTFLTLQSVAGVQTITIGQGSPVIQIDNAGLMTGVGGGSIRPDDFSVATALNAAGQIIDFSNATALNTAAGGLDLLTTVDGTGAASNNSGLEIANGGDLGLAMLQGCGDNQIIKWTESTSLWGCAADAGGSGAFVDADPIIPNTTTNDMALGVGAVNSSKFSIDGDADQVQMTVQGQATQTDSIVIIENSAGTEIINLDKTGDILSQSIQDIDGPGTAWSITAAGDFTGVSFTADDAEASATKTNALIILDDDNAAGDSLCSTAGAAGQLMLLDSDESATDDFVVCEGTAELLDFNAVFPTSTTLDATVLTGSVPAASVGADHLDAISEIAAGIKRGPDATDTHLVTTDVAAPGALTCLEMDTDGSLVLAAGSCASLGPGGTTTLDALGDAVATGAVTVGSNQEYSQVWTWNLPAAAVADFVGLTLAFEHDSTTDAFAQRGLKVSRSDGAGTGVMDSLLLLENLEATAAVTNGIEMTSAAGLMTNAINLADAQITNAFVTPNATITMTEFEVIDGGVRNDEQFCTYETTGNQIDCDTSGALADDDLSDDNPTALQNVTTINDGDYCQGNASSGFDCDVTLIQAGFGTVGSATADSGGDTMTAGSNDGLGLSTDTTNDPEDISASFDYAQTLAGNPALATDACIFSTEGTSGGGFICQGGVTATNEQLHIFADQDGADTTDYIVTTANTSGKVDDFGVATDLDAAGELLVDTVSTSELDSNGDAASTAQFVQVDSVDSTAFMYRTNAEVRTTLALVVGTNVQAWDNELDIIAALTTPDRAVMFGAIGGDWTADQTPAIDCTDCINVPTASDLGDVSNVTLTTPANGGLLCFTGTANDSQDCTVIGDIAASQSGVNITLDIAADGIGALNQIDVAAKTPISSDGGLIVVATSPIPVSGTECLEIDSADGIVDYTGFSCTHPVQHAGNTSVDVAGVNITFTADFNTTWTPGGSPDVFDVDWNGLNGTDGTGITSSGAGFEFADGGDTGYGLLQGCGDNQIIKWTESTSLWGCAADDSGGAPPADSIDFVPIDYSLTLAGNPAFVGDECFFTVDVVSGAHGGGFICQGGATAANEQKHVFAQQDGADTTDFIVTTANTSGLVDDFNLATALDAAGQIDDFSNATALNTAAGGLDLLTSVDGTGATSNQAGLEIADGGDLGLAMLQGCGDNQIIKWTESTSLWGCAADGGGGSGAFSDAGDPVVLNTLTKSVEVGPQDAVGVNGKLEVVGDDIAEITLVVEAELSQTADIFTVQSSAGADFLNVASGGDVTVAALLDTHDITITDLNPNLYFQDTGFAGGPEARIRILPQDTSNNAMIFHIQQGADTPVPALTLGSVAAVSTAEIETDIIILGEGLDTITISDAGVMASDGGTASIVADDFSNATALDAAGQIVDFSNASDLDAAGDLLTHAVGINELDHQFALASANAIALGTRQCMFTWDGNSYDALVCEAAQNGFEHVYRFPGMDDVADELDWIVAGQSEITDVEGTGLVAASEVLGFDYLQTLAGSPVLNADECLLSSEGAGGGFICEGTTANASEQLHLFPAQDGVDTTDYIATAASDGDALAGDTADSFWDAGTVEVARGGTNLASGTSGGILGFTGSTTLASTAALVNGDLIVGGGAGAVPTAVTGVATGSVLVSGGVAADPIWDSTPDLGTPSAAVLTNATGLPTAGIVDLNVTEDKLAADLVFDAGDLLNLTAVDPATALAGIYLPQQAGACVGAIEEGSICWDSTGEDLYIGNGASPIQMNAAAPSTEVRSMYWGAGSMEVDGTQCAAPTAVALVASGPTPLTVACADNNAGTISGSTSMPDSWNGGTVTFTLVIGQIAASTQAIELDFEGQCIGSDEAFLAFAGTGEQPAAITLTADDDMLEDDTPPVTLNGTTCAGGDVLVWRGAVDAPASGADIATAMVVVGVKMEYTSDIGD